MTHSYPRPRKRPVRIRNIRDAPSEPFPPSPRLLPFRLPSPFAARQRRSPLCVGTPRPTPSRMTARWWQVSWLADRRLWPPSRGGIPSGANDRRLAAYSCGGSRGIPCRITGTAFPIDPFREPPATSVAPGQMGVNTTGRLDACRRDAGCAAVALRPHRRRREPAGPTNGNHSKQWIVQKQGCGSQFNMLAALNGK